MTTACLKERKEERALWTETDGEGEDFSLPKREGGAATDSIPEHIVWRCRSNRVQYYHTACCINRRFSLQQPCRQDGDPAEWMELSVGRYFDMTASASILALFGNEHCGFGAEEEEALWERWERPDRLMRCCHSGCSASLWCVCLIFKQPLLRCLLNIQGWKILSVMCGRELKLDHCSVKMGSLFPWYVQKGMSHFQHIRVCWDSTFVSTLCTV